MRAFSIMEPAHEGSHEDLPGQPRAEAPGGFGPRPTAEVPDHELLRRIGRGAYGEVWLARNVMGMFRAVKLVFRKSFKDQKPFERELSGIRKFEPISRSHEGFIDVLHVGWGKDQEFFYYVMELGDDEHSGQLIVPEHYSPRTLSKELASRGRLSLAECVQFGLELSQALAALHKNGLVHRDVKPSNIIFINGIPKLADLGLVADISEARSFVGTEGFIPPEGPGTPQADIYSLGKVLYEASTGRDRQDYPELPTLWDEYEDRAGWLELNTIVLEACAQDTAKRYASAQDLQADLIVLANGKSVRRLKVLEQRLANLKRVVAVFILACALVAAVAYGVYREWRINNETRKRLVHERVTEASRHMETGDFLGALPQLAQALQLDQGSEQRQLPHRLRYASVRMQSPKLTHFWMAPKALEDGQFSPNGKFIVVAEYWGQCRIYDLTKDGLSGQPFGRNEGMLSATLSGDGQRVATGGEDSTVWVSDVTNPNSAFDLPHSNRVHSVRFSPDGIHLVSACNDHTAYIWNVETHELERRLTGHKREVLFATYSHDGKLIATASVDGTARIWDAATGDMRGEPFEHRGGWVYHVAFSSQGDKLVTAGEDRHVKVWAIDSHDRVDLRFDALVHSAEFSPDGKFLATACYDGAVSLWCADNPDLDPLWGSPVLKLTDWANGIAFSPDSRCLLTFCRDGSIRIWDLAGMQPPPLTMRSSYTVDGARLVAYTNGVLKVFDTATNMAVFPVIKPADTLQRAQLTRNGKYVFSVSTQVVGAETNQLLQVWECSTGTELGKGIRMHTGTWACLSEDGKWLATFDKFGGEVRDVSSGVVSFPVKGECHKALFSPDGTRIAIAVDNTVSVYIARTGQRQFALEHDWPVESVEFSNDNRYLVTCCRTSGLDKCYAQLWNAVTGKSIGRELKHGDGVWSAAFEPGNSRLATASEDCMARLWALPGGDLVGQPLHHLYQVGAVGFSTHAKWLGTVTVDWAAHIWSSETGERLTAPLRQPGKPRRVLFPANGNQIATEDDLGNSWTWDLRTDKRPVADLVREAAFLNYDASSGFAETAVSGPQTLESTWAFLRKNYAEGFQVSQGEAMAWHQFQAADAESKSHWWTAVFHLEELQKLKPGDQEIAQRLQSAQQRMGKAK
jgi:WD40 repeat protein